MHIFYSFISVYSQTGEKEEEEEQDRTMKREMMFLNIVEEEKYKITHYQLSDERVQIRVHEGSVASWEKN